MHHQWNSGQSFVRTVNVTSAVGRQHQVDTPWASQALQWAWLLIAGFAFWLQKQTSSLLQQRPHASKSYGNSQGVFLTVACLSRLNCLSHAEPAAAKTQNLA